MATLQKNFPLEIGFMGVAHSSSEENSCNEETCFGAISALLPDLTTPKFTALTFQSGSHDGVMGKSGFGTPKRKLQGPSCLSTLSPDATPVQRELASINEERCTARVTADEFILLDPCQLRDTASCVVFKGNQTLVEPSFRPIPQIPSLSRTSETDDTKGAKIASISNPCSTGRPMLDLDRRLQEDSPERWNNFVPIHDDDDDDEEEEEEEELSTTQTPSKGGKVPTFKLKPRKSRRMQNYSFTW
jgi:hypothetical protein